MKQAPLYLEVLGTLPHVMRVLEERVPRLFPAANKMFLGNIEAAITQYAKRNSWDIVAVHLSRGLARWILDDIVKYPLPHTGSIVIDPTGSTPEYQLFERNSALRSAHERLIEVNEATDDILIIVYGVDAPSRKVQMDLLMRRARMNGTLLDLMDGEDVLPLTDEDVVTWRTPEGKRRMIEARRMGGQLYDGLREGELGLDLDHMARRKLPANAMNYLSFVASMWGLSEMAVDPAMRRVLAAVYDDIITWPRDFDAVGLSLPALPPSPDENPPEPREEAIHLHARSPEPY